MSLLALDGVSRAFGGLRAVDGVSMRIDDGISALIGPNGAGKTTLFNLISGRLAPDEGRILFQDRPIHGLRPHCVAALGLVRTFQLVQLFGDMTVAENVAVGCHLVTRGGLGAALLRLPATRRQEAQVVARAQEMLDFVGLAHLAGKRAADLTYGHQRLLEIARAVAAGPRLLLLDEPAAGLNAIETDQLADTIRAIAARGIAVLLVEHDMDLVMRIAAHVVVLDFGRKIAEGPPEAVSRDPAVLEAYLGGVETAHG